MGNILDIPLDISGIKYSYYSLVIQIYVLKIRLTVETLWEGLSVYYIITSY